MPYDDYFTPRILLLSDGEADSTTAWREPMRDAEKLRIIIDVIALLSKDERGKDTLAEIAKTTGGSFIMPENLKTFIQDFVRLSKKKHAQKVENIILCLDVSGSMSEHYKGGGEKKIEALKEAVLLFAREKLSIDPRDRVGAVLFGTYDGDKVKVLFPPGPYNENELVKAVSKLKAQNGTPLAAGLRLAIHQLDVPTRRKNFKISVVERVGSIEDIPGHSGDCHYCLALNKPTPQINGDNWHFFEGIKGVMVYRCPVCKSLYHGMCFDKYVTRSANAGVCYNCGSVIGYDDKDRFRTPEPATGHLYICPGCNEPLPPEAKFCSFCGRRVDSEQAAPSPAAWTPPGVPGTPGTWGTGPVKATRQPAMQYFNPVEENLVPCPKCGYSCQETWGTCPVCNTPLKKGA